MATTDKHYLFPDSSARRGGNTETLARRAAAALPASAQQTWLSLANLPLPPFEDVRHAPGGCYPMPEGAGRRLLDATLAATDIVFVVPLYWYSVPASTKRYLDHWSGWMRVQGVDFLPRMAAKTAWAVSVISDEDSGVADPLIGTLRLTAQYCGMNWGGGLLGYGNRPDDILSDAGALSRADRFFAA